MIDLEVPVEGVARDALDAFLCSDQSPPDSAALIFDSGPRVIRQNAARRPPDCLAPDSPSSRAHVASRMLAQWSTEIQIPGDPKQ
jgi:hypothetical protein